MKGLSSTGRGSVPYFYLKKMNGEVEDKIVGFVGGKIEVGLTQSFLLRFLKVRDDI